MGIEDLDLDEINSPGQSQNSSFKSGFVTMIGRPNVGKSTLMNQLIGQKIAITSNKPQTTRNRIKTVYTDKERGQIVFVDTPGIHKAKNRLGEYMMKVVKETLGDVDLVLWLVEPKNKVSEDDLKIAETLSQIDQPVILIINKCDMVSRDALLPIIEAYRHAGEFAEIIPLSARKGTNCDDLMDTIYKYLPYGPAFYDEDTVTDQTEREIVAEIIREKSLYVLQDEIPHGIAVTVEKMNPRKGKHLMDIEATIYCERESHKGIIIGKKGAMLKRIGTDARYEIEKLTGMHCDLKLWVKVRKNWRDSEAQLKNFGYRERNDEE